MAPDRAMPPKSLAGRVVVITRPAGTAAPMARQVRARGGEPLALPGLSLRGTDDAQAVTRELKEALRGDELLVFTSPAAVRFAARLAPLRTRATDVVRGMRQRLGDRVGIIGVGGILEGDDAVEKLQAGAQLVQVYSGLIYRGPELVAECVNEIRRHQDRPDAR